MIVAGRENPARSFQHHNAREMQRQHSFCIDCLQRRTLPISHWMAKLLLNYHCPTDEKNHHWNFAMPKNHKFLARHRDKDIIKSLLMIVHGRKAFDNFADAFGTDRCWPQSTTNVATLTATCVIIGRCRDKEGRVDTRAHGRPQWPLEHALMSTSSIVLLRVTQKDNWEPQTTISVFCIFKKRLMVLEEKLFSSHRSVARKEGTTQCRPKLQCRRAGEKARGLNVWETMSLSILPSSPVLLSLQT